MAKTLVCVNILDTVNAQVYGSHTQEWFRMGRQHIDDQFILFHPNRFSIDNARNQAAIYALMYECDYLYFIDDDMILSPNTYGSLKAAQADIAQALTFVRSYPFHMMAFEKVNDSKLEFFDDYHSSIDEHGLIDCEAVGFACVLIKTHLLKLIEPPYFVTGSGTTEDVYFCLKLRQALDRDIKIVVDTNCPTSHLLHSEAVNVANRDKLVEYYKEEFDHINGNKADRGEEYLKSCKAIFPPKNLVLARNI